MDKAKKEALIAAKRKSVAVTWGIRDYLGENLTDEEVLRVYEAIGGSLRIALKAAVDEYKLITLLEALASAGMGEKARDLGRVVDEVMAARPHGK